ncbi:hypothetical protein A2U01_0044414, partial [Trifolium medium]|nr:hypothetical protein [Trifolium medium]
KTVKIGACDGTTANGSGVDGSAGLSQGGLGGGLSLLFVKRNPYPGTSPTLVIWAHPIRI